MASLLDYHRELLEKCGLSTGGLNSSDIDDRARAVLDAADRYRLQAEAGSRALPHLCAYPHRWDGLRGGAALLQVPLYPRVAARRRGHADFTYRGPGPHS